MVAAYCPYCGAPAHKDWGCSDLGIGLKAIRDDQYRYDHEPSYKEGWDKGWRARQQEMEELRQDRRVLEKACEDLKVKVCNLEHPRRDQAYFEYQLEWAEQMRKIMSTPLTPSWHKPEKPVPNTNAMLENLDNRTRHTASTLEEVESSVDQLEVDRDEQTKVNQTFASDLAETNMRVDALEDAVGRDFLRRRKRGKR